MPVQKTATTSVPIHPVIAERWSGRAFDAVLTVPRQQIIALLEAARWAPSCHGDQPWRFIVWDRSANAAGWQAAFDCLVPGNQTWARNAPVLMLSVADTLLSHNNAPNRHAQYDTGAAAENLCLQAAALGLMAHQMGGFYADKARIAFNIPDRYIPMAMIAIGYAADPSTFTPEVREREMAPRQRRSLRELFFAGTWEKPLG